MRTAGFARLLALAAPLLFVAACVEPVKLVVTPVPMTSAPAYEPYCPDPAGSVTCLSEKKPNHRLQLAGEEILWVKMSPDEKTIVASTVPAGSKPQTQRVSFLAFDTADRKLRWRIQLSPNARIGADDVHFVGTDKIALLTEAGFLWGNTLLVVNAQSGAEVWRTPQPADKRGEPVQMLLYDPDRQYFVVGSSTLRVLDAHSGQVLATRNNQHLPPGIMEQAFASGSAKNPRVTGGMPHMTDRDLYLYNFGLVRLSRDEKKFVWGKRFATFAEDDYTGANVGLAIAGALLGASTGNIPPDYLVGRTTEPSFGGGKVVAGALGLVHCLDEESGALLWTQDLAVPQIARVAVRGDRVYVLAGGSYIFWHGRQGMSVRTPVRSGLYALHLADGTPVSDFASPFNPNKAARRLTAAELDAFDEDDAFEEEEDWGDLKKPASPSAAAATKPTGAFTKKWLVGFELLDRGMLVATDDAVVQLDDSGAEIRRHALGDLGAAVHLTRMGDRLIVRTRNGALGFDARSGEKAWQKKSDAATALGLLLNDGAVPIVRTLPWRYFHEAEAKHYGAQFFWTLPEQKAIVLPISAGRIAAVRLENGETMWQMETPGKIAIGEGWVAHVNADAAELYRVP